MRLLLASGIVKPPTEEEVRAVPDLWERLVYEACRFLRAGGAVAPDAWALFSDVEKAALDSATKILASERAALNGVAAQGLGAALEVAAAADQGVLRSRVAMAAAAGRAAAAVLEQTPVGADGASL